jgi:glycosyltransferase involved in cell wall biosynthesis
MNQLEQPARALRVLLIAPSLEIIGGQAVQAARLLSALSQCPQIEVTFLSLDRPFPRFLRPLRRLPYLRTITNIVLYNGRLFGLAREHDILHIFTAGLWSYTLWTIPALLAARLWRKRAIINYRDGRAEQHLEHWRSARATLRLADRIVAPSGYLVDVFARYGLRAQSIFNIIDANRFRYRQRTKLRPVFLSNRSLEPLYNVACILRAFAIIQERFPEATLTVAHDGVCRRELELLAAELKLRNVHFTGKVPPESIPDLYDAADVYLTTPNIDCMPGSLLECFVSGLPVIATAAGGIPYIAEDRKTALLVGLNDHQAVAARAIELLENPDLVERLTQGALKEVARYRPEAVAQQWLALYRELVSNSMLASVPQSQSGADDGSKKLAC